MKVGDLVTLSAAGRKITQNFEVREGFGVIVKMCDESNAAYPIFCHWVGGERDVMSFKRYELRRMKSGG